MLIAVTVVLELPDDIETGAAVLYAFNTVNTAMSEADLNDLVRDMTAVEMQDSGE